MPRAQLQIRLNRCGRNIHKALRTRFGPHHDLREHAYYWQQAFRGPRLTAAQAHLRISVLLMQAPMNHEVSGPMVPAYIQAVVRGLRRCGQIRGQIRRRATAPAAYRGHGGHYAGHGAHYAGAHYGAGHYGLIVNTADTAIENSLDAAMDGVGPLLTTLNGNGNGDPAADTMEAAANGTAIDGGPIEPPVDGAPDSAAAMDAIINGNGAAVVTNGNGNGTPSTYAEKGIIGTYVSDIKTHPVAMASAFAVGWFLARR